MFWLTSNQAIHCPSCEIISSEGDPVNFFQRGLKEILVYVALKGQTVETPGVYLTGT